MLWGLCGGNHQEPTESESQAGFSLSSPTPRRRSTSEACFAHCRLWQQLFAAGIETLICSGELVLKKTLSGDEHSSDV